MEMFWSRMQLKVDKMKLKNAVGGSVELNDAVFSREYNETLVHQAVVTYMAGGRSGTKAQKTRSDVSGGGAKPWRQKGTGRARAGTSRGPIWRKGGVTFAARPRDYSKKMNKKMYRAAMCSILSELVRSESLIVVDELSLSSPSTKSMVSKLNEYDVSNVLLVDSMVDKNVALSINNVPNCEVSSVSGVNPVNLIAHDKVIMTQSAIGKVEEWLS